MLVDVPFTALPDQLASIKAAAESSGLPFAGGVAPATAWELFSTGRALLVDVRTGEERKFVGHVGLGAAIDYVRQIGTAADKASADPFRNFVYQKSYDKLYSWQG